MPSLNGNYIDLIIIIALVFFMSNALRFGFWIVTADFVSFLASLLISFKTYKFVSDFLKANFNLLQSISDSLGFLISAIVLESVIGFLFGVLLHKLPEKVLKHKINKIFGVIPAIGEALVLVAFLLMLVMAFPIKPQIKTDVSNSKIGGLILDKTSIIESYLNKVFGGVINDTLTYLTIKPDSGDTIKLEVGDFDLKEDPVSERAMFEKINEERQKIAINKLVFDDNLTKVARVHAKDMWLRRYFSHYSPEGKDVGDRLSHAKIAYTIAGENLALAPTVQTAHTGLMNSTGHRENILNGQYRKVGIGVIDNGVYGKMFVQVFTD